MNQTDNKDPAICPSCKKPVTEVTARILDFSDRKEHDFELGTNCLAIVCPHCNTILSTQMNPLYVIQRHISEMECYWKPTA